MCTSVFVPLRLSFFFHHLPLFSPPWNCAIPFGFTHSGFSSRIPSLFPCPSSTPYSCISLFVCLVPFISISLRLCVTLRPFSPSIVCFFFIFSFSSAASTSFSFSSFMSSVYCPLNCCTWRCITAFSRWRRVLSTRQRSLFPVSGLPACCTHRMQHCRLPVRLARH